MDNADPPTRPVVRNRGFLSGFSRAAHAGFGRIANRHPGGARRRRRRRHGGREIDSRASDAPVDGIRAAGRGRERRAADLGADCRARGPGGEEGRLERHAGERRAALGLRAAVEAESGRGSQGRQSFPIGACPCSCRRCRWAITPHRSRWTRACKERCESWSRPSDVSKRTRSPRARNSGASPCSCIRCAPMTTGASVTSAICAI